MMIDTDNTDTILAYGYDSSDSELPEALENWSLEEFKDIAPIEG